MTKRHEVSIVENKMAVGFSGALQLTDLDDFITPSQVSSHLFMNIL